MNITFKPEEEFKILKDILANVKSQYLTASISIKAYGGLNLKNDKAMDMLKKSAEQQVHIIELNLSAIMDRLVKVYETLPKELKEKYGEPQKEN